MNIIDRIKLSIARYALKQAGGWLPLVPPWVRHSTFFPSFEALVREGYRKNATVFACSNLLQKNFPEPEIWPWRLTTDGDPEKLTNHPLRKLLEYPNLDMGESEWMAFCITYCSLGGNIYNWKQRAASQKIVALWPFHDGQMQPIPGRTTEDGLVAYYVLDDGSGAATDPLGVGRHEGENAPGIAIPKEDIIHWKWAIDPGQPWRGMGAIAAAAVDVDIKNELNALVLSSLKNDATPPFIVTLMEGEAYEEDHAKRLGRQWQAKHGGRRRGLPAFLEKGMGVIKMGFDPGNVNVQEVMANPDVAVCQGFGIPPIIISALVGLQFGTYSNYEQARRAFAEDTLIPIWRSFASELDQAMRDEPGMGGYDVIRFDVSMVGALQVDVNELWERIGAAFDRVMITRSEARTFLGMKSEKYDDVYKEALGVKLVPKEFLKDPEAEPPPSPFGAPPAGGDEGDEDGEEPEEEPEKGVVDALLRRMDDNHTIIHFRHGIWETMADWSGQFAEGDLVEWKYGDISYTATVGKYDRVTNTWPMHDTAAFQGETMPPGSSTRRATPAQIRETEDFARAMRDVRDDLEGRMRAALVLYFDGLAGRIVARLEGGKGLILSTANAYKGALKDVAVYCIKKVANRIEYGIDEVTAGECHIQVPLELQQKVDFTAEQFMEMIFQHSDREQLTGLIEEYQLEIMNSSWDIINVTINSGIAFDLTDPAVTEVLALAGDQVKAIEDSTKDTLRRALQEANERGWSIDQMIAGDPESGIPSLRSIIEQTYKNRDKAIARTELGIAQNTVTASRYAGAGVEHVIVFDGGGPNSDDVCNQLDGTVQTLAWARANPLQHPNCVRAFGPLFD